jgi:hypothetical protein
MSKRNRNPLYWRIYHSSGINDRSRIISLVLQIIDTLGSPWKISRRGRPPKFHPKLHAAICIYMLYRGWSYRETEGEIPGLVSMSIDHSTVGWAMKRIPLDYVSRALKLLHMGIDKLCRKGVFIADSTGIETDRCKKVKRVLKKAERREFRKLHAIAKYYPRQGITSIASAGESDGYRNDSSVFREIFDPMVCRDGLLFADRAYDAGENMKLAYRNRLLPVIKQKDHDTKPRGVRRKAGKDFDEELYKKFRGIIEGIFGGMETRYGNKTRCRLEHTRKVSVMLMAVAHNIRAYLKTLTFIEIVGKEGLEVVKLFFHGIIRQPLFFQKI